MKNYYKILEVSENASIEVIEKAYRVLVRRYHPDLQGSNPQAEEKIREINEAYDVLSDSFLKEQYDKELKKDVQVNTIYDNFQETDYSRIYKEKEKLRHQLAHEKYDKERIERQKNEAEEIIAENNNTQFGGMISLVRGMFKHWPKLSDLKKIKKLDFVALGLTIVIVIGIGLILYFLPFTHDWMKTEFLMIK